jgi:hypothetical protein
VKCCNAATRTIDSQPATHFLPAICPPAGRSFFDQTYAVCHPFAQVESLRPPMDGRHRLDSTAHWRIVRPIRFCRGGVRPQFRLTTDGRLTTLIAFKRYPPPTKRHTGRFANAIRVVDPDFGTRLQSLWRTHPRFAQGWQLGITGQLDSHSRTATDRYGWSGLV